MNPMQAQPKNYADIFNKEKENFIVHKHQFKLSESEDKFLQLFKK